METKAAYALPALAVEGFPTVEYDGIRIYRGDNLRVLPTLYTESVDLVVTSPPYPGVPDMWGELFAPENFDAAHQWLDRVWDECARVLKPGCKLIVNVADMLRNPYLDNSARISQWAWKRRGRVEMKGKIIWNKGLAENGETAWGSWLNPADVSLSDNHEFILVFRKRGNRIAPTTAPVIDKASFLEWRKSEWTIRAASASDTKHIAPFPPELPMRLITLYSFPGETVLDPFLGSGTTLMQAKLLGRKGIGIELSEQYFDLSCRNLSQMVMPGLEILP